MKQDMLLCGMATLGLFIPGCAQQPAPATLAMNAAQPTLTTQPTASSSTAHRLRLARDCQHPSFHFGDSGGSTDLTVSNEGGWCIVGIQHHYGMPFEAVIVTTPPAHGKLTTRNTNHTYLRYRPVVGYVGADHYIVDLLPGNISFRANITVVP